MDERKLTLWDTFCQALIVFIVLNLDILGMFAGALMDGKPIRDMRAWSITGEAQVTVYFTIFVLWGLGLWYIFRWFKKNSLENMFDLRINSEEIIGYVTAVLICIAIPVLLERDFPEITRTYREFTERYGSFYGLIVAIQQVIYYLQETFLVVFMIVLFQKTGETKFKKTSIPWGSIGLIFTWGIIHFVSHTERAVFIVMEAALYGIFYLVSKKKFYPLFLLVFLHFIL